MADTSRTAMVFAAGLGTRLRPLTQNKPKALVEVAGRPLLGWVLLRLKHFAYQRVVVNVHHFADQVIAYLQAEQQFGLDIMISDERDVLLETGGGLKKAAPLLRGADQILIHNADVISDLDLRALERQHQASGALATLAVRDRKSSRYLWFDEAGSLCGWENQKTGARRMARDIREGQRKAFSGIHLVSGVLLPQLSEQGKFSIIESYLRLASQANIQAFDHSGSAWFDVGKPENLTPAARFLQAGSENSFFFPPDLA